MIHILIVLLVFSYKSLAIEAKPVKEGNQISFVVNDLIFPENFEKTLKSGLSNVYILKLSLWKDGQSVFVKDYEVKIVFDLWDEMYFVTTSNGSNSSIEKYSVNVNILEKLKTFKFTSGLKASDFKKTNNYEIKVSIIVDPITKEKQKKIKAWLAENQVNIPGTSGRAPTSKQGISNDRGASTLDTVKTSVFNKVLNSELDSEIVEGAWVFNSEKLMISNKEFENEK
ncbi:MAG: hypothetical protein JNM24_17880 [Bdellovibrionaceae bacterium]|nr:hypothetical protein [Pseudobdellovibrionaceae bacterium]